MKNNLENIIRKISSNRKLHILNLFCGNEKCIQGDIYSELNGLNLFTALEYPLGDRQHGDIVIFRGDNYIDIDCLIELKHYSPHQTNPHITAVTGIKEEVIKRFNKGLEKIFVIQIMTQIEAASEHVIDNYPFTKQYLKNTDRIQQVETNGTMETILDKIRKEIDSDVTYISATCAVNEYIQTKLHFYICGPFIKNDIFINNELTLPLGAPLT